jgi:tetratricopeptide (TPR) repeat protein
VAGTKAMVGQEQSFEQQIQSLDKMVAMGNFDITKNVLSAYAHLFNRFYADEKKRSIVEEKINSSWTKMPVFIRIELLGQLADFALEHQDLHKALEIVNQAQKFIDDYQWPVENKIPLAAGIVKLRYRAGDIQKAKKDVDALLALYNAQGKQILDIERAETLQPLAEAFQTMGDKATALVVYKKAIDEGTQNPNSRPRAEDVSATCCSMAIFAVEPDTDLWTRIHAAAKGLGNPW